MTTARRRRRRRRRRIPDANVPLNPNEPDRYRYSAVTEHNHQSINSLSLRARSKEASDIPRTTLTVLFRPRTKDSLRSFALLFRTAARRTFFTLFAFVAMIIASTGKTQIPSLD